MTDTGHLDLVGQTFAEHYEILSRLGEGGMGVVYKARHKLLDHIVAIKVLHDHLSGDPQSLERIRREGRTAAFLDHPNIVKIRQLGVSASGQPFLVMDYLEGTTLSAVLESGGPLLEERFLRVFTQCLDALIEAHKAGVVHRDLKPGNIMISPGDQVRILDFGIAKILPLAPCDLKEPGRSTQALTQTGALLGSPGYMSPEQCLGQAPDHRSDLYSLACVMYEALTGRLPFAGATALDTMYQKLNSSAPDLSAVAPEIRLSPALADLILKAMAKNPQDRFQSASDFKAALEMSAAQSQMQSLAPLSKHKRSAKKKGKQSQNLKLPILCLVLLLAAFSLAAVLRKSSDKTSMSPAINPPAQPADDPEPQSANAANQLADRQLRQKRLQAALISYQKALKLAKEKNEPEQAIIAHVGITRVPDMERSQCNLHFKKAVELSAQVWGPESFRHSETLFSYAYWLDGEGRLAAAEQLYKEVKTIREKTLEGPNRSAIAYGTYGLAHIHMQQGLLKQAEQEFREALKLREDADKYDYWETTENAGSLAQCLKAEKKYSQAVPVFERYIAACIQREDASASYIQHAEGELADCYRCLHKWPEAAASYGKMLAIAEAHPELKDPPLKQLLLDYAGVLRQLHRNDQAKKLEERAALI